MGQASEWSAVRVPTDAPGRQAVEDACPKRTVPAEDTGRSPGRPTGEASLAREPGGRAGRPVSAGCFVPRRAASGEPGDLVGDDEVLARFDDEDGRRPIDRDPVTADVAEPGGNPQGAEPADDPGPHVG